MAEVQALPSFDISNEAWREYDYGGKVLRVENPKTMILDKRLDGDRHRLILSQPGGSEIGMYVAPGWLGIRWQTRDGKHGIVF